MDQGTTSADPSVQQRLFAGGGGFDFFQAIRLLEGLAPEGQPVGRGGPPAAEIVRFGAPVSLAFPQSTICGLDKPTEQLPPFMTVAFMGLTGPSGVLPRHYTELLIRLERDAKGPEKHALRAWLDLFNHRLISLFYRAWEKYHFVLAFERREFARREPDSFTRLLFSLMGLGTPSLRDRLRVARVEKADGHVQEQVLVRLEDLSLLRYGGLFAHRPRCAVSLEAMLCNYLGLPVQVLQFQGQWLRLDAANCSSLGAGQRNNAMGLNVVVGDRVWDVQGKIRIRIGPLRYDEFQEYLPDRSALPQRKAIFLLGQMVRLYVGPEVDIEIQLVLRADEVPPCRLSAAPGEMGSCLGWNTWSRVQPLDRNAEEPVFQIDDTVRLEGS